jgi:hypothetical protein
MAVPTSASISTLDELAAACGLRDGLTGPPGKGRGTAPVEAQALVTTAIASHTYFIGERSRAAQ